jgi:hypothetical protein
MGNALLHSPDWSIRTLANSLALIRKRSAEETRRLGVMRLLSNK